MLSALIICHIQSLPFSINTVIVSYVTPIVILQVRPKNDQFHQVLSVGLNVLASSWDLAVLQLLENLNQQSLNQYNAIQLRTIEAALEAFSIVDFYPSQDEKGGIFSALAEHGTVMSAVGGFVLAFGSVLGAARVLLPAVGSSIEYAVTDTRSELLASKEFSKWSMRI